MTQESLRSTALLTTYKQVTLFLYKMYWFCIIIKYMFIEKKFNLGLRVGIIVMVFKGTNL